MARQTFLKGGLHLEAGRSQRCPGSYIGPLSCTCAVYYTFSSTISLLICLQSRSTLAAPHSIRHDLCACVLFPIVCFHVSCLGYHTNVATLVFQSALYHRQRFGFGRNLVATFFISQTLALMLLVSCLLLFALHMLDFHVPKSAHPCLFRSPFRSLFVWLIF